MLHFRELSRTKKRPLHGYTKRSTPISGKIREINYIPEGDEKAKLNLGLYGRRHELRQRTRPLFPRIGQP